MITLFCASLYLAQGVHLPQGKSLWDQANQNYRDGNYQQALTEYMTLYDQGIENGPLLFNIGNANYKTGKVGHAILFYEKALIFLPNDSDLKHNLERALTSRPQAKSDPDDDQMAVKIRTGFLLLPYRLVYWITAFLLLLAGAGWFVIFWKAPGAQFRVAISTIGIISFLMTGVLSFQYQALNTRDRGVILKAEESVRSGPSRIEDVSFSIYEGKRVTILARSNGWVRIRLSNGYNGWVPENAVGII